VRSYKLLSLSLALVVLLGALSPCLAAAGVPPSPEPAVKGARTINDLPWRELWAEMTFNGRPAGYSHGRWEPLPGGLNRFQSEAVVCLGGGKEMSLRSVATVAADLSLRRLDEEVLIDGSSIRAVGEVREGVLQVAFTQAGRTTNQSLPLGGQRVYSEAALDLLPWLRGLEVGSEHRLLIFDAQERRLVECRQTVAGRERLAGFEGEAVRLETSYAGMKFTSWISPAGVPLLGQAMGAFVVRTVDEARAKAALAEARGAKGSPLDDYILVRTNDIPCRQIARLVIDLEGLPAGYQPPTDARQTVKSGPGEGRGRVVTFTVDAQAAPRPEPNLNPAPYLAPAPYAESDAPEIVRLSREVVGQAKGAEAVEKVVGWVNRRLRPSAKDCLSALDALRAGEGDCQAHAYLCTALLRAAGIPCRPVSGLCYSAAAGGFLYHTWCEAYVGGWLAVDPVFGGPADAGHLKLIVGERIEDVAPLTEMMGRIRARVVDYRCLETPRPGASVVVTPSLMQP